MGPLNLLQQIQARWLLEMQTYWIRVSRHGVWASAFHSSTQWLHRVAVKQGIFRGGWHHRDGMTEPGGHEQTNSTGGPERERCISPQGAGRSLPLGCIIVKTQPLSFPSVPACQGRRLFLQAFPFWVSRSSKPAGTFILTQGS